MEKPMKRYLFLLVLLVCSPLALQRESLGPTSDK